MQCMRTNFYKFVWTNAKSRNHDAFHTCSEDVGDHAAGRTAPGRPAGQGRGPRRLRRTGRGTSGMSCVLSLCDRFYFQNSSLFVEKQTAKMFGNEFYLSVFQVFAAWLDSESRTPTPFLSLAQRLPAVCSLAPWAPLSSWGVSWAAKGPWTFLLSFPLSFY